VYCASNFFILSVEMVPRSTYFRSILLAQWNMSVDTCTNIGYIAFFLTMQQTKNKSLKKNVLHLNRLTDSINLSKSLLSVNGQYEHPKPQCTGSWTSIYLYVYLSICLSLCLLLYLSFCSSLSFLCRSVWHIAYFKLQGF